MTRLVYDIYAPPGDDWLDVVNSDGYLVRVTDYGPQTNVRPRKPMGTGLLQVEKTQSFVNSTNFAYGNYVIVRDLDRSDLDDTANVVYGFFLEEGDFDLVTDDPHWFYWGGRSTLAVLDYAILPEAPLSPFQGPHDVRDGYWDWGNDVYGGVMKRAIVEANAPGRVWLPMVAIRIVGGSIVGAGAQWDDSGDSNGDPWPSFDGRFRVQCGTSLLDLYGELYGYGVEVEVDPRTFVFYAYNAGGYGTDRSSGTFAAGKVRFETGVNIAAKAGEVALKRQTHGTIRTSHLLVRTADHPEGTIIESDDYTPGDPIRVGVYESGTLTGDPTTSSVLESRAQRDMDLRTLGEDAARFLIAPPQVGESYDDTAGIYVVGSNYAGNGPEVMDGAHVWLSDLVTIDSGAETTDYQNAVKRIDGFDFELHEGNWVVYVIVGARFLVSGRMLSGTNATVLPIQFCTATVLGEATVVTGKLYFSSNPDTSGLADTDYAAGWDDAGDVDGPTLLKPTPDGTLGNGGSGIDDYDSTSVAAGHIVSGMHSIALEDATGLLEAVQGGATWDMVIRSNNRHGLGITEANQENYPEGVLRVWRPGTDTFIGTILDIGQWVAAYIFSAGPAWPSIPQTATGAAVPGAVGTDRLVLDLGAHHVHPDVGDPGSDATGWSFRPGSDAAEDLPFVVDSQADQNAWIRYSYVTAGEDAEAGDGRVDLVGTATKAKRCDDTEHFHSALLDDGPRAPTVNDDVTQGFRVGTLWLDDTAADGTGRMYWLTDNTEGAAVWILVSQPGSTGTTLEIAEEDGDPSGSPSVLKFSNGRVTDNGDGSFSVDVATVGAHAHEPPSPGVHKILVKRTTNFAGSNSNDSIPDLDTVIEDTMTDSWWDVGAPDRFVVTADYDGLDAIFTAKVAVGDPGSSDYLECKMYLFPASYGEPRPMAGTSGEEDHLLTVEQQPATNDINHFIRAISDPVTVHTGDVIFAAWRSPVSMTYIPYNGRVSGTLGAYILPGGTGSESSPSSGLIIREVGGSDIDPTAELEFDADDFVVTDEGGGVARVALATTGGGSSVPPAILLESGHAVPFTFDDILQESDGSDFLWASE